MKHKLWVVAFILTLLKIKLDFFHDEVDGDRTLGSQEGDSLNCISSINHITGPHPPVQVSGNSFPLDTARTALPPTQPPPLMYTEPIFGARHYHVPLFVIS